MPDQRNKDEIDLLTLMVRAIHIIKSNFWIIVSFFLLGAGMGVGYFYTAGKVYKNNMILSSSILTESYSKTLFENFNKHIDEGNAGFLATQLGIPESTASKIYSLKIESITEVEEAKEKERFLVTIELSDPEVAGEIQKGLIQYLENNEFVKLRVEQNKSFLKQMIASVEKEIKDMEEFKLKLSNGDFFQTAKGNIMFDPTTVNSKILELTEKKIQYENSLQLSNSVQVIEGFTKFHKQTSPRLTASVITGAALGLLGAVAVIIWRYTRKLIVTPETA